MGNTYFISDLHFGHKNMALYRGFNNVEEHDNYIIENWNKKVNKKDCVWILGDISMEKKSEYYKLQKLNGFKKVVLGNHDLSKKSHNEELLKYVNSISEVAILKKQRIIMTHVPVHVSELEKFEINIHGHLHGKILDDKRYINVSCEVLNYTPKTLKELLS